MSIRIGIVGLGFGAEFIPIYQAHPSAELVAICQRSKKSLDEIADRFDVPKRYTDFADMLADDEIDAVHINTPIPMHGQQSIEALKAGKHVACTVPMATTVEECEEIVRLSESTGLKYMMMETVVYSREYLFMKELRDTGELGDIQFLKASHQQDMEGWPDYWPGLPPMHYATHCVGPILGLADTYATAVSCLGSGKIRPELQKHYGSPFAIETCHFKLADSDVVGHVYRSLFDTARQYREGFEVYASKKSVEWPLVEGEELVVHTAGKAEPEIPERVACPDFAHLLPDELSPFTLAGVYNNEDEEHLSFTQGAGHGGSHPHLAHQFVEMLVSGKQAYPGPRASANITCVGVLAHESAMNGGVEMALPELTLGGDA
ncbi:MAG: Gfo/Idh/MocA family oxidoreductase [Pseudomonadota bacterium]